MHSVLKVYFKWKVEKIMKKIRSYFTNLTIVFLFTLLVASCGKSDNVTINVNEIKKSSVSDSVKSDVLALEGEKLVTPISLPFADKVFDEALALNPNNRRALLYKTAIAPLLLAKGLVKRASPVTQLYPELQEKINKKMKEPTNPRITEFLNMGVEDILNEKDIQAFVYDLYFALDNLRLLLKDTKTQSITLNIPYVTTHFRDKKILADCSVSANDGVYVLTNCNSGNPHRVSLNQADLETVQHMVAGVQLVELFLTAYNLEGSLKAMQRFNAKKRVADIDLWSDLSKDPLFGRLKETHKLDLFARMGNDAVLGFHWAKRIQEELCPNKKRTKDQRKGFLFSDGLCTDETMQISSQNRIPSAEFARLVEVSLSGGLTDFLYEVQGSGPEKTQVSSKVQLSVLWAKPIEDVRTLGFEFTETGNLKELTDKKAGGIFVNGDVNQAAKNVNSIKIKQ